VPLVHRHADPAEAARAAAERLLLVAGDALSRRGVATIALAGGKTPELLYGALAERAATSEEARATLARVDWFFSDERRVPPTDPRSNYGAAARALFAPLQTESRRVRRLQGEAPDADAEARRYEADVLAATGEGDLDLVLLGMGKDGHTASLFPNAPELDEATRLIVPAEAGLEPFVPRLTMTFAAFRLAREIHVFATGAEKAEVLRRVLVDKDLSLPVARVAPASRRLAWFVDAAAAARLP
jgi:6-phosphogluconolactonase